MSILLLMIFKLLNAQLYCKQDGSKSIDQKSEENHKIYFIQFQVIVDDEEQKFIRVLYYDRQTAEIVLKYSEERFFYGNMKIPFGGIGIWQYVFLNSTTQITNIIWYSNFKLLMNQSFIQSHIHSVQLLQKIYIQIEFIDVGDIQNFVQQCHQQQKIILIFDPQLSQIMFGSFNNNLIIISLWFKFVQELENHFCQISINPINSMSISTSKFNNIQIYFNQKEISIEQGSFFVSYDFYMVGWTFFTVEFNNQDNYLFHKCFNLNQSFISEKFQYHDRFIAFNNINIQKPHLLLLTQVQLNLDHFNDTFCIPGCLICQDIFCLSCEKDLLLKNGECVCNKEIYFSLNECFFPDLENFTIEIQNITSQIVLQNCPKYDEQLCSECVEQNELWEYPFCQYSQIIEHDQFLNYHVVMVVFYQLEENRFLIDNSMSIINKESIYQTDYNNILLFHKSIHQIYQLGIYSNTNQSNVQCQEGYFGDYCKPKIKNCLIQLSNQVCQLCQDRYFNLQNQCKMCPFNCEKCLLEDNFRIKCVKCANNYFLGLDYKCKQCVLQNCLICYQYDDDQISLQEFSFKQNNLIKSIGCADCQSPYHLNFSTRLCQLDIEYLDGTQYQCSQISNCLYCQKNICLFCEAGYLNIDNICLRYLEKSSYYRKKKKNHLYNNFWKEAAIITFVLYNYDYSHIIENQKGFIIKGCDFPQLNYKNDEIYCRDQHEQYKGVSRSSFLPVLNTFVQFNLSVQDKIPYLMSFNSLVDPRYYKSYLLQNIHTTQLIDLTIDTSHDLSFSDQQQLFGCLDLLRIKINYTFNNDQCIIFNNSKTFILNNSYIGVGNLCLVFEPSTHIEIRNSIFEGVNKKSSLKISNGVQQYYTDFLIQNVTFKNFKSDNLIKFQLEGEKMFISKLYFQNVQSKIILNFKFYNLNLSELEIFNDKPEQTQFSFILETDQFGQTELNYIKIYNCIFEVQEIFNAVSKLDYGSNFKFNNIQIQASSFNLSTLLNINAYQLQINNFNFINCTINDSEFLILNLDLDIWKFLTKQHQQFIEYFLSPIIINLGLLIPLILLNYITQLTKRLFKKKTFQTFGSLHLQYRSKFEIIIRYYLTSLLLSLFQINLINVFITPKDLIMVFVLMFAFKKTYKIKKFNKIFIKSWICIGLVTYIIKIEQEVIDALYIQFFASSFIIIYILNKYIRQLIFAYDKQIYGFIQSRRKLSSYFISKILYHEKQYWKLINQLVKLHKLKFVSFKQQSEKIILETVLKQSGQHYHNLPTLKTEANEGIEMQQL